MCHYISPKNTHTHTHVHARTRTHGHTRTATNPAVEGLVEELTAQAAMLEETSPARAFLASEEVVQLIPMGVVIPENGAVRVVISMATVVLVIIVGLAVY